MKKLIHINYNEDINKYQVGISGMAQYLHQVDCKEEALTLAVELSADTGHTVRPSNSMNSPCYCFECNWIIY